MDRAELTFWGVRGSVPSPLTGEEVFQKVLAGVLAGRQLELDSDCTPEDIGKALRSQMPFEQYATYGGNTSCVELRIGEKLIIFDMGTGMRPLGSKLLTESFARKAQTGQGLRGTILQSHMHWDHIQGLPFFKPLYLPRAIVANHFDFFGGQSWQTTLEDVLQNQMEAPTFPVNFAAIKEVALSMSFNGVFDGWQHRIPTAEGSSILITARVLDHPQETFGYRVEFEDVVVVYTTDHEPRGHDIVPERLCKLVQDASVWITDCQYSHAQYCGRENGPERLGWGHSYPEYIATVARAAKPDKIFTFHHDPDADDKRVAMLAKTVQNQCGIPTFGAYEGLTLTL